MDIPISKRNSQRKWNWNGSNIAGLNLSTADLWHEIAHWIIASPEERKLINFGLGPDANSEKIVPVSHEIFIQNDKFDKESLASALGIAYQAFFHEDFMETLYQHNWTDRKGLVKTFDNSQNLLSIWEVIHTLNVMGFMNGSDPILI